MRGLIKGKKWLLLSRWKNLTPTPRGTEPVVPVEPAGLQGLPAQRESGAAVELPLRGGHAQLPAEVDGSTEVAAAGAVRETRRDAARSTWTASLNYCRTKVRFGVVEAVNGNIRMLINRGRGYKNLRYLLLKAKRMAVTNIEFIAVRSMKKAA